MDPYEIAKITTNDLGGVLEASRYCQRIANQNGQDAKAYLAAAQILNERHNAALRECGADLTEAWERGYKAGEHASKVSTGFTVDGTQTV